MEPPSHLRSRPFTLAAFLLMPLAAWANPAGDARLTPPSAVDLLELLGYVSLALFFSFLCSVAEAVLLSITPSFIEGLRQHHPGRAERLYRLKHESVDRSLAAILTLNTIAHTVGAIASGAKAAQVFGDAWFGVFSAVMTLLILFLSEIVPKTLGTLYWHRLTGVTGWFVLAITWGLYPVVRVSEWMTRAISRGRPVHIFSRDEFLAMSRVGERSGQINASESRIIRSLFRFGELKVRDIMTPRPVVSALSEDMTLAEAFEYTDRRPFSRLPVYRGDLDHITGFVLRDEILLAVARGGSQGGLTPLLRPLAAVPEALPLPALLERLLENRQQIAQVVDEYGGTLGLVAMEDLVETLVGIEIVDENDRHEDMRQLARRLWRQRRGVSGEESGNL
jgi:CBS domain containing-hemolysin-like protein